MEVQALRPAAAAEEKGEKDMSTTVLDALEGAKINFETLGRFGLSANPIYIIAIGQLTNGIAALRNGRAPRDVIQESIADDVDVGPK